MNTLWRWRRTNAFSFKPHNNLPVVSQLFCSSSQGMQQTRRLFTPKMSTCRIWKDPNHLIWYLGLPAIITKILFPPDDNKQHVSEHRNNSEWRKPKAIDNLGEVCRGWIWTKQTCVTIKYLRFGRVNRNRIRRGRIDCEALCFAGSAPEDAPDW